MSGGRPPAIHPALPYLAARLKEAGTPPPITSVGGATSGPIESSAQTSVSRWRIASMSAPRLPMSAPIAAKSSSRPPRLSPRVSRPPERALRLSACLPSSAPLSRSGASSTAVTSPIRSVTAAAPLSAISDS